MRLLSDRELSSFGIDFMTAKNMGGYVHTVFFMWMEEWFTRLEERKNDSISSTPGAGGGWPKHRSSPSSQVDINHEMCADARMCDITGPAPAQLRFWLPWNP